MGACVFKNKITQYFMDKLKLDTDNVGAMRCAV